jgi:hypothetical protein
MVGPVVGVAVGVAVESQGGAACAPTLRVENAVLNSDAPMMTADMLRTRRRVRSTAFPPVVDWLACRREYTPIRQARLVGLRHAVAVEIIDDMQF